MPCIIHGVIFTLLGLNFIFLALFTVNIFANEYKSQWNCKNNVLLLTPRSHLSELRSNKIHSTQILMENMETEDIVRNVFAVKGVVVIKRMKIK